MTISGVKLTSTCETLIRHERTSVANTDAVGSHGVLRVAAVCSRRRGLGSRVSVTVEQPQSCDHRRPQPSRARHCRVAQRDGCDDRADVQHQRRVDRSRADRVCCARDVCWIHLGRGQMGAAGRVDKLLGTGLLRVARRLHGRQCCQSLPARLVRHHRISFTWQSWSDVLMDDGGFRRLMDVIGAVLNLVAFVAVAGLLTRVRIPRRSA